MAKSNNQIIIFDTTLRDGEQSPGASMSLEEKIQIARAFEDLGVDVMEAGFPAAWSMHFPSHIDIAVYLGTIGLFFVFFLLFARYFPVLALNEVKTILKGSGQSYKESPDYHKHH